MEIQKFDLPSGTECKVVSDGEHLQQPGWRLIAILSVVQPMSFTETETDTAYISRQVWKDATTVRYVLARDPNDAIESALSERDEAIGAEKRRRTEAEDAKAELQKVEKQRATLESDRKTLLRQVAASQASYEETRDLKRKLEGDIGKIRAAVGEIRMKEILGS